MKSVFNLSQGISVFLIGLGIGWLAGLSVSAVVSTIIASLLGLAAGIVTGLQSIQKKKAKDLDQETEQILDAKPAAILVLGIALATPFGIMVRTHHVLEPPKIVSTTSATDSLKRSLAVEHLNSTREPQEQGVLFSQYEDECTQLLSLAAMKNDSAFIRELKKSSIPGAPEMVAKFHDDPEVLEFFLNMLCRYYQSK